MLDFNLQDAGIKYEKTNPKNPEQNFATERRNTSYGMLVEAVRSIISDSKLPKHFFGQKLSSQQIVFIICRLNIALIINKTLCKALQGN